jgi:hypothetical protein
MSGPHHSLDASVTHAILSLPPLSDIGGTRLAANGSERFARDRVSQAHNLDDQFLASSLIGKVRVW